jgi:multidrug resistance efflux pump
MRPRRAGTVASVGALLLADRRLRVLAAVLLALCAVSVLIFARFRHLDWADAVYFTFTVVTIAAGLGNAVTRANDLLGPWWQVA